MQTRDFSTISQSARWILYLKALTTIPYAKEAARAILGYDISDKTIDPTNIDMALLSCASFEARYRSIDAVLNSVRITNHLEISSGFSFRGLELTKDPSIFYVDTDLPDLVKDKQRLIENLLAAQDRQLDRRLQLMALNAMDEGSFLKIVNIFPPGPIAIINEGLLVYLDDHEKTHLASIIHKVLSERGGFWVTGDIYVRGRSPRPPNLKHSDRARTFLEEHKVFENMFESWDSAMALFNRFGFSIEVHGVDEIYDQLDSRKLIEERGIIEEEYLRRALGSRQTWMLQVNNLR